VVEPKKLFSVVKLPRNLQKKPLKRLWQKIKIPIFVEEQDFT
jgi:hypothetical protein